MSSKGHVMRWLLLGISFLLVAAGLYQLRSLMVYLWMTYGHSGWTLFAPGAYETLRNSSLTGAMTIVLGVSIGVLVSLRRRKDRRLS